MTRLVSHLARYGAYHRDRRNIAVHGIGIPLIVLAVEVLLSRFAITVAGVPVTAAVLASLAAALFYLWLDFAFGLAMAMLLALGAWAGMQAAAAPHAVWLSIGIGMFVAGWAFQFIGHVWEGRRPAFIDDLTGLLIGPLFIVAELAFAMGLRRGTRRAVEEALAAGA